MQDCISRLVSSFTLARDAALGRLARFHEAGDQANILAGRAALRASTPAIDLDNGRQHGRDCSSVHSTQAGSRRRSTRPLSSRGRSSPAALYSGGKAGLVLHCSHILIASALIPINRLKVFYKIFQAGKTLVER